MDSSPLILLVADAGAGHFLPVFGIAKQLKRHSNLRVVICSFDQRRDEVQAAGIGFVSAGGFSTVWDRIPKSRWHVRSIAEVHPPRKEQNKKPKKTIAQNSCRTIVAVAGKGSPLGAFRPCLVQPH